MHAATLAQLGECPPSNLRAIGWCAAGGSGGPFTHGHHGAAGHHDAEPAGAESNGVSEPHTPPYSPNYATGEGNGWGGTDLTDADASLRAVGADAPAAPTQQQPSPSVIPINAPNGPNALPEPVLVSGPGAKAIVAYYYY